MKAAQIKNYGGDEVVEINQDLPKVMPTEGKILIEVLAAGVNPLDWKIREGYAKKWGNVQLPLILGHDFSGVVMEIGQNAVGFRKGEEVYGQVSVIHGTGSFAEYILVDPASMARKPKTLNYIKSAALPLAGVSAYQALIEQANLSKGQKILIHGGAGGIGSIAIQFARHMEAYIATTVRYGQEQFARQLGAHEVIDFTKNKFEDMAHDYDVVFDTVGGDTYAKSFSVAARGGVVVSMVETPRGELMEKYGVNAIYVSANVNSERLMRLAELVDDGAVKVYIDKVFPLDRTAEALSYLQKGHPQGKVVITVKDSALIKIAR